MLRLLRHRRVLTPFQGRDHLPGVDGEKGQDVGELARGERDGVGRPRADRGRRSTCSARDGPPELQLEAGSRRQVLLEEEQRPRGLVSE